MECEWCWSTAESGRHHGNMPCHSVKVLERTSWTKTQAAFEANTKEARKTRPAEVQPES